MKTFTEFLNESWALYRTGMQNNRVDARHEKSFGRHKVSIALDQAVPTNEKRLIASFYVNHSEYKSNQNSPDSETGKQIYTHVSKRIGSAIRHMKPKAISFNASEPRLEDMYEKFGKRLAKKHGGTYEKDGNTHRITFKRD